MTQIDIQTYNDAQTGDFKAICELLCQEINECLPEAASKVWHGAPVWFINDNPVVGYWVRKQNVQLLFWSGQSFDEPGLKSEGTFKAAEARYEMPTGINQDDLRRWLQKAKDIQWDYKNIVKRKGELIRLK